MATKFEMPTDPFRAFIDAGAAEAWRKSMFQQMERFWEGQKKLIDEYQSFSRTLLDRRKAATDATLETVRKMTASTDGSEWAKCASDWLSGSITRMTDDGRDLIQEGMKVMAELSQSVSAGMGETAQAASQVQQSVAREAGAAQAAAADQASSMAQEAARAAKVPPRPKRPEEGPRPGLGD
jgi:hypothetical protein